MTAPPGGGATQNAALASRCLRFAQRRAGGTPKKKVMLSLGGGLAPSSSPLPPKTGCTSPPPRIHAPFWGGFWRFRASCSAFYGQILPSSACSPLFPFQSPPMGATPPKSVLTRVHDLHRSGYGGGNLSPSPSSTHPLPAHEGSPKSPPCCWPPEEGDGSSSGVAARTPQPPHTFFSAPPPGGVLPVRER